MEGRDTCQLGRPRPAREPSASHSGETEEMLVVFNEVGRAGVVSPPDERRRDRCCTCVVLVLGCQLDVATTVDRFAATGLPMTATGTVAEHLIVAEPLPKVKKTSYIPVILTSPCVRSTSSWLICSTERS